MMIGEKKYMMLLIKDKAATAGDDSHLLPSYNFIISLSRQWSVRNVLEDTDLQMSLFELDLCKKVDV